MLKFKKPALVAGSLMLAFSLIFLAGGSFTFAGETDFDELTSLNFRVEGTYEGEPAEFWYRLDGIGTEQELFRLDVTTLEGGENLAVILDQKNDRVFTRQMGIDSWEEIPSMMLNKWWNMYREDTLSSYGGKDFWYGLEEDGKGEYLLEGEDEGEEYTVRVYHIEVDEPIEESVFTPDGS